MSNAMNKFLNPFRQSKGSFHTHVSMIDNYKGIFNLGRQQIENLWELHSKELENNTEYISGIAEKPQNYSMLRADVDNKELTESKTSYELCSMDDALKLIKDIQQYLVDNIEDCNPKFLDCALLTKPPYISNTDKGIYNKHGYHLQFINCFISKEDNTRIGEHFHNIDNKYDKIYNHPWLLYGSQKKKETGKYTIKSVITHDGKIINPEDYFKTYKIYNDQEKVIKYDKHISWYYPRILSIIPYNRLVCNFNVKIINTKSSSKYKNYEFTKDSDNDSDSDDDINEFDDDIKVLIEDYILNELDNALEITESTEIGFKLRNRKTFKCPIDPTVTHNRLGAFVNIHDGSVYFGCYKCRDNNNKCSIFIGRFRDSKDDQKTFQEIMEIKERDRTEDEKKYLEMIFKTITKTNLDKLTKTTLIPSIKNSDKFVQPSILLNSNKKVVVIKAGLGRGKSTSVSEYIKQTKYDNIIILTPRRSYARSAKDRLIKETGINFTCYLDKKKSLLDENFVVIQAESLYRLQINHGSNLIVIDEAEAFLSQLTSSKTHRNNHVKNIETFIQLIKNSNKVIALDAFISNRTLKTFIQLSGANHINFYEYTQKLRERKATEVKDLKMFLDSFISDLEKGKKIFLFSSSNTKLLTTVKKTYKEKKDGSKKQDEISIALLPAIREKFPNKTIIEFHSKFISIQLMDVNNDWKDADVVACTSTITVGCNFDTPNVFHKVYLYANASSKNLVRDMFQASWRIRHLIDDEMVFCLDENHYGSNLTTNIKEIKTDIQQKNDLILKLSAQQNLTFPNDTPVFVKDLLYHNKLEQNMSIMCLRDVFERYLELCNYKICDVDINSIIEVEFDEFITDKIKYYDIPSITPTMCKILINKKTHTPLLELESLQVEKFHFQCLLLNKPEDVEEGLWKIYSNFGKGKFRNISIEKGIIQGTCSIQDIIEKQSYSHFNSGICLRLDLIREITSWIGMTNTSEYGYRLTKDKLDSIINNFEDNRQKIHIAFDMRDRTKAKLDGKTTVALINKILDRWSYSSLKADKKQKKILGKVVVTSDFVIIGKHNDEIEIEKHIKPYGKQENETKHPLLMCKEDKKIITENELEMLRLNIY
jgi:hypothetical protein